jgi:hypothetical protein
MFGGCRQVGADRGEVTRTGQCSQAVGDFSRSRTMRISRSAVLLSNGTRKSVANRR